MQQILSLTKLRSDYTMLSNDIFVIMVVPLYLLKTNYLRRLYLNYVREYNCSKSLTAVKRLFVLNVLQVINVFLKLMFLRKLQCSFLNWLET